MTQAHRTNRRIPTDKKRKTIKNRLREMILISFCFVGLYLFVSLLTYYGSDPGISHSSPVEEIRNKGGIVGALFADLFFHLFGYFAYLFPLMVGYVGWIIYQGHHHTILAQPKTLIVPGIGFILTLSAGCGLGIVHFYAESILLPTHAGGILGGWIGNGLVSIVSRLGATLILIAIFFAGVTLLTGLSWLKVMDTLGSNTLNHWLPVTRKFMRSQFLPWFLASSNKGFHATHIGLKSFSKNSKIWSKNAYTNWQERRAEWKREREEYDDEYYDDEYYDDENDYYSEPNKRKSVDAITEPPTNFTKQVRGEINEPEVLAKQQNIIVPAKQLPSLDLLTVAPKIAISSVEEQKQQVMDIFVEWDIEIEINAMKPGPVLNYFEINIIDPIDNTNDFTELSQYLATSIRVQYVKIIEINPEKIHLEIPNSQRQIIYLSELLNTPEYQENTSALTIALGQNVGGQAVIVNLIHIPHILIAGSNSMEKKLGIDTLILSLLYKSSPDKVRLLLIDDTVQQPLTNYNDLPHLLLPVIDEAEIAYQALQWCMQEMENRYRLMAKKGAHNIEDYNQSILIQEGIENKKQATAMYYIIIIINEIAELTKISKIEQTIIRLTQRARSAGIHLILGTEHTTVNVITGLLKSNIPTRMAFAVANQSESRTILGQTGAENLLGKGDMLYMTAGTGMPTRVHNSFVTEEDIKLVVTDLASRDKPEYINLW